MNEQEMMAIRDELRSVKSELERVRSQTETMRIGMEDVDAAARYHLHPEYMRVEPPEVLWHPFKGEIVDNGDGIRIGDGLITAGGRQATPASAALAYGYADWPYRYMSTSGTTNVWTINISTDMTRTFRTVAGAAIGSPINENAANDESGVLMFSIMVDHTYGNFYSDAIRLHKHTKTTGFVAWTGNDLPVQEFGNPHVVIGEYTTVGGKFTYWRNHLKENICLPMWYYDDGTGSSTTCGYHCGFGAWLDQR